MKPSTRPGQGAGGGAAGDFLQNRPSTGTRPAPRTRPGTRPGAGDRPGNRPGVGNPGNRPGAGNPGDRPGNRPGAGNPGDRPGNRPGVGNPGNRPGVGRPPGSGHRPGHRPPGAGRPPGYRPPGSRPPGYRPPGYRPPRPGHLPHYGGGYWGGHSSHWGWQNHSNNWWAFATAGALTGWVSSGWANQQPIYYDYGTNLYYEDDNVYYDGEVVATSAEYAEQAQAIATDIPEVEPDNVEWMPLGVFALTQKDGSVEDATLFMQLAISKEGIIAGTFSNTATDKNVEVEGTIDQKSQRAAWGPVGESWPIMETGIFNLTESDANALVHFANGESQEWSMSRVDEPEDPEKDN